jgi:hypothetical protein
LEADHIASIEENSAESYSFENLLPGQKESIENNHPFIVYNPKSEMIYIITLAGTVKF